VTLGGAHHRQSDARVTARRLDHRLSGLQRAVALGRLDDAEGEPVLHGAGRIEELGLDVDGHVPWRQRIDPYTRSVAHGVEHALEQPPAALGASLPVFHAVSLSTRSRCVGVRVWIDRIATVSNAHTPSW